MSWTSDTYVRLNAARLAHLASLGLPLSGRSVLEVGAGVGDLTGFWLGRGCEVTATDGRASNVREIQWRYPAIETRVFDVDDERAPTGGPQYEIVFCYGLLYHLQYPGRALARLGALASDLLLVETTVEPDGPMTLAHVAEDASDPWNALGGKGSRFARSYVRTWLEQAMPHVYATVTQPDHEEFPTDWAAPLGAGLHRAVFVGSRTRLDLPSLVDWLPVQQERYRG